MQYTGMTEVFGAIGEMFNMGFKGVGRRFEKSSMNTAPRIVEALTKNNRPLKILGVMSGSFVVAAGTVVSNRKLQNGSLIPSESWVGDQYKGEILPRLQQAVDTAFKYAQNGNISLLDPHLDSIAEIVIQYPQFRYFVKYKESLKFPKSTYFDAENGGMTVTLTPTPIIMHQQMASNAVDHESESKDSSNEIKKENQEIKTTESAESESLSVLSTNPEELEMEMTRPLDGQQGTLQFENQLDYIRHLCVIRRSEKIYFRAIRHAQKGNVQECSQILAEVWEYVHGYEYPLIIEGDDGKRMELKEEDLVNVMRLCHRNYAGYLIECAKRIGEGVDRKNMNQRKIGDVNKKLLSMVHKTLENARIYAQKYNVFDDEVQCNLKSVWQNKQDMLKTS